MMKESWTALYVEHFFSGMTKKAGYIYLMVMQIVGEQ
jgi:hypothetical protein